MKKFVASKGNVKKKRNKNRKFSGCAFATNHSLPAHILEPWAHTINSNLFMAWEICYIKSYRGVREKTIAQA